MPSRRALTICLNGALTSARTAEGHGLGRMSRRDAYHQAASFLRAKPIVTGSSRCRQIAPVLPRLDLARQSDRLTRRYIGTYAC